MDETYSRELGEQLSCSIYCRDIGLEQLTTGCYRSDRRQDCGGGGGLDKRGTLITDLA